MTAPSPNKPLYIFLDEGGNFDFSPSGTKYFTLTCISTFRPFPFDAPLTEQRFDLIEGGLDLEYFHAADDRRPVRDRVFSIIEQCLDHIRADTLIVEKSKVHPEHRTDVRFYPEMLGYLLSFVFADFASGSFQEVIVITDRIPVNRKRNAIEKAIKQVLTRRLAKWERYRIYHHDSKSCYGLQVADYINWAVYRAWDRNDRESLNVIQHAVSNQIEVFAQQIEIWY